MAGLAAAAIVVEARERSGALITADLALEEGREVFAVPGEITSRLSEGTNRLLRLGATALTCTEDVLEAFGIELPARDEVSPDAECVLELLPATADDLARALDLEAGALAALLAELELSGVIAEAEGVYRSAR